MTPLSAGDFNFANQLSHPTLGTHHQPPVLERGQNRPIAVAEARAFLVRAIRVLPTIRAIDQKHEGLRPG